MKLIKSCEIIDIRDGTHDSPKYVSQGYPLITSKNIKLNKIDFDNVNYITRSDYIKINKRSAVANGDIIMPMIGTVGNPVIVNTDVEFAIKNVALFKKNENIETKYLYYVLISPIIDRQFNNIKRGGTQKFISLKNIRNLQIPLPPLSVQKRIVDVLDKAQSLIDKRKEQIALCDELVQSVFYDMFGDPVKNEKGWEVRNIGDIFDVKTGATPSRSNKKYWSKTSIPWVKTNEVIGGTITSVEEYVNSLAIEQTNITLFPLDTILIAMYGQGKTRGRVAKLGIEATTNQACAALIPNNSINVNFIFLYLKLSYERLRSLGRGGNQPNLNLSLIRNFSLILPTITLQNQFADKVQRIEAQKELMQRSLEEMEDNFAGLMQRAFRGEIG